jgi:hypothetical protein
VAVKIRQIGLGLGLAILFVIGAERYLSAATCEVQCSCVRLLCGGSGCSCSAWGSAWFACGGIISGDSSGCDWDCGGANNGQSCCNQYCYGGSGGPPEV